LPMLSNIDLLSWLTEFRGLSVALALNRKSNFYAQDFRGALAFIAGNEGAGLSQAVIEAASVVAQIPMPGKVESLNASAALAVAVFEAVRQRGLLK
jgi:RNA methyltransferase, TrmH family